MLQVVSIGTLVQDPACYASLAGKTIVYPHNYAVRRAVFINLASPVKPILLFKDPSTTTGAAAAPMEEPYFTATVSVQAGDAAGASGTVTFTVTRSDDPDTKKYSCTKTPTTAWRTAVEAAAADFPEKKTDLCAPYDGKGRLQINGIRLFGLHLKEVQEELMALPGGAAAFEASAAAAASAEPHAGSSQASPAASQPTETKSTRKAKTPDASSNPVKVGSRGTSPAPKAVTTGDPKPSATGLSADAAPTAKSASRKRTSRTASMDKEASNSVAITTVVDVSAGSDSQTPSVVAVTPVKTRKPRKPKTAADTTTATMANEASTSADPAAGSTDGSGAPPARRRRASAKNATATATTNAAASPTAAAVAVVVCPDCGLSGTPFCATTGKPHDFPPCPVCGLKSAFCPVTGQPHAGPAQRENRQRGEVHLPGATRKPRKRTAAAGASASTPTAGGGSGDVMEVTVVSTQDGSGELLPLVDDATAKKPRRKRVRAADGSAGGEGSRGLLGEGEGKKGGSAGAADGRAPARARRSRKTKPNEAAAGAEGASSSAATATEAGASSKPADEAAPAEQPKEAAYVYPPLRPPLTTREHSRAAHLLLESWKAQYGDGPVLLPAVASIPLAFVPAKRTAAAANGGAKGGRRGRRGKPDDADGGVKTEEGEEAEGEEENRTNHRDSDLTTQAEHPPSDATAALEGKDADNNDKNVDEEGDEKNSVRSSAVGSPTTTTAGGAAALPSMVHPLEVTQLASSVAGKRLTRFLLQYASERSQFDLLRSHASTATATAAAAGAAGSAGKRVSKAKKPAASEDASGDVAEALPADEKATEDAVAPAAGAETTAAAAEEEEPVSADQSAVDGGDAVEAS